MKTSAVLSSERDLRRAEEVKRAMEILNLDALLDEIEQSHISVWSDSSPHEHKMREQAYEALHVTRRLRQQINLTIQNGKLAEIDLKRNRK